MLSMRLALVDTLFSWPPHGGACTDVYYTARELQAMGHEVCLFMAYRAGQRERAAATTDALPFPSERIEINQHKFDIVDFTSELRTKVDAFAPDAVLVCDAFFIKPHIGDALAHYPQAWRYYAYEAVCPRDHRRFLNGERCEKDYFSTPNECRQCAVDGMGAEIRSGLWSPWTEEFVLTCADRTRYYDHYRDALARAKAVIVYNEIQRDLIATVNPNVHVVPGGVDLDQFPEMESPREGKSIILMTGRCEDPAKGFSTLLDAAKKLAAQRDDFEVWATTDIESESDYFKPLGWKSHEEALALCREASICVVPSLWHEPFGMVAVEAMAAGRPVVAADGGGLSGIVDHEVTGYLYPHGGVDTLANYLSLLLDDADLRKRMGRAGAERVTAHYDWPKVVNEHYPEILEALQS